MDNNVPYMVIDISDKENTKVIDSNMENYRPSDELLMEFAKGILPLVEKHFQDPENQKRFEEWKKKRDLEKAQ